MHAVHDVLVMSMPGSFGRWLGQGGLRKRRGSIGSDCIRLAFEEGRDPECYGTKISRKAKLEARELTGGPNHTTSNSLIPQHNRVFEQGWEILLAWDSDRGLGAMTPTMSGAGLAIRVTLCAHSHIAGGETVFPLVATHFD